LRRANYLFFAAFFFPPLAFFAIEDSSLHWWIAGSRVCAGALCRLARRPGRPATSPRGLTSDADAVGSEQQLVETGYGEIKKWGARRAPRRFNAEKLPLLRGLFLSALGSLLRHFFLLRLL
jgi:hypothetical protein